MIGQGLVSEALERGHQVTAIARNEVAALVAGHDGVISDYGPGPENFPRLFSCAALAKHIVAHRACLVKLGKQIRRCFERVRQRIAWLPPGI